MTQSEFPPETLRRFVRAGAVGFGVALVVAVTGLVLERSRFGPDGQQALRRVESELRERFKTSADQLGQLASVASSAEELAQGAPRDASQARRLFERLDTLLSREAARRTGITVFDASATPVAWTGHVSDLARPRITGPSALFVAPGAFGPRLIRIEPLRDRERPAASRTGTIAVEQLLGDLQPSPEDASFLLAGLSVPVQLRDPLLASGSAYSLAIHSSDGGLLVEADVRPGDLAAARGRWRAGVQAASLTTVAFTLAVCAALLFDMRRRARRWPIVLGTTLALIGLLAAVRFLLLRSTAALAGPSLFSALDLLLDAALLLALTALAADSIETWRVAPPRRPLLPAGWPSSIRTGLAYFLAGVVSVALIWSYERFLQRVVSGTALDPLHFSLHPLSVDRLALAFGLLLLHAAVIWSAALIIRLAGVAWRIPRSTARRMVAIVSWAVGVAAALAVAQAIVPPVPYLPLLTAVVAAAACTLVLARPRRPVRRASQAARLFGLYVALLIPAVAAYPSLHALAVQEKEDQVAAVFGPQAATLRDELQRQLRETLAEIDAMPGLASLFERGAEPDSPTTNRAFSTIWARTPLSQSRLTSSVELYGLDGELLSRFALNLPEYEPQLPTTGSCSRWDVFEDVAHVLKASRSICLPDEPTRPVGTLVVRAMLDYRTLPFISSPRPYFDTFRPDRPATPEGSRGRDVEFTLYGWSRAPIYVSGTDAWRLSDEVFERAVGSREAFWETVTRSDDVFRVYFLSDRGGIYALSYPVISPFGHLMNLAELVILAGALYVLLLLSASVLNALASHRLGGGQALLREVRSSFYRKLFLAFVAVAVIPAIILAIATRNRLARQFELSVNETAVKTATVAQRLVEDYATLDRADRALGGLSDSHMVLVGRTIDQDVNLYNGPSLQATSERDLFASELLPDRTPADVYRSIALDRLPSFVSIEDAGGSSYLLAAAPVRAAGGERIVTVPQALRQRELEQQIDDLDRRVWSAFVLFVLLGAGLGYWMAERIADPVSRLTRATRRIARGDLDARIAATSSDELRRLVEDFNRMAADLQRQRAELERTQRLEAWADMARQVAHDVKNPLTPIQLSAEHARRINMDRGRPLSPVLDECVTSILTQVTLLRQIAAEFSSFASSPTARPEPTDLASLIEQVVAPYRVGLAGRILVSVSAQPELPTVTIDRTLFSRALTNVIENALHAMPGAGRLDIRCYEDEGPPRPSVRVTIADTGVGMDPEALSKIFEPYFSTKATGTGLGLTIAKRNVELNGGTVMVESQKGSGTTVTIVLPLNG